MSDEQKQTVVLYTAMPDHWNDEECLDTIRNVMKVEMPLHDTISEIVSNKVDARVVRVTVDVMDGTLADHRTGEAA